jgi:hypothetical protein
MVVPTTIECNSISMSQNLWDIERYSGKLPAAAIGKASTPHNTKHETLMPMAFLLLTSSRTLSYSPPRKAKKRTYPTLTQHPPLIPFSIKSVLAPYHPEARLAAPLPPDPPPMTI